MQSSARRHVEIETLEDFDRLVAQGATSMTGWQLQDVDLRKRGDVLERLDARGALYLGLADGSYGSTLDARAYAWVTRTGDDLYAQLARSLHDLAVDDALDEHVR